MALHVDANGVGRVTPNYLYHPNGSVPHPLQRSGNLPHLPDVFGNVRNFFSGHPFFGKDQTATRVP